VERSVATGDSVRDFFIVPSLRLHTVGIRPWRRTRRDRAPYGERRHTDLGTLVLGRCGGPASGCAV